MKDGDVLDNDDFVNNKIKMKVSSYEHILSNVIFIPKIVNYYFICNIVKYIQCLFTVVMTHSFDDNHIISSIITIHHANHPLNKIL